VSSSARGFVLRHTHLQNVLSLDGVRLQLADDVNVLWHATQLATGDPDTSIPFWAFAWGGGLAIASYLRDHPEAVAGRRVLDIASGSGLCAIAAARAGATVTTAVDIDPYAIAAIGLNAKANRVAIDVRRDDLLDSEPPDVDVILAGDAWYEERFAARMSAWLQRAHDSGIDVLIGDPGRRYLAHDSLRELATYDVRSTTDLEDLGRTSATVYELAGRD
jgi:predicted nicotinamide N-methyase